MSEGMVNSYSVLIVFTRSIIYASLTSGGGDRLDDDSKFKALTSFSRLLHNACFSFIRE